ncbi:MAG: FHA domain-containing protein [Chloroflexi bacterium]|nr:FHA domain-containing protein [Chloroflexota bacterium]
MSAQVNCENCGKLNDPATAYCYACGHILPAGMNAIATRFLENGQVLRPELRWGTAYFGERHILRIRVRDSGRVVETQFQHACVLGRAAGDVAVDVDLTPYGAVEMGVSRQHAKLTHQSATVMVQDLGSVNGTYLNGVRLVPHQPRVLRDEDELCLGRLTLRVSFLMRPGEGQAEGEAPESASPMPAAPESPPAPAPPAALVVPEQSEQPGKPDEKET